MRMAALWGEPYVPSAAHDTDDEDYNEEDPAGDAKNELLANMAERLRLWMTGKRQMPPMPQSKSHTRRRSGQQGGTTMALRASKDAARVLRDAVVDVQAPRARRNRKSTVRLSAEELTAPSHTKKRSLGGVLRLGACFSLTMPAGHQPQPATAAEQAAAPVGEPVAVAQLPEDHRHPDRMRLTDMRNSASNRARAAERAAAARQRLQHMVEKADTVFLEFSKAQVKQMCVTTFVQALDDGHPRMVAYEFASVAARVDVSTTRRVVKEWLAGDGFFSHANWSPNEYIPMFLGDEDVANACREWWRERAPRKGEPNPRIADFRVYLCGPAGKPEEGLIYDDLRAVGKDTLSEQTCRKYAIWLGFAYREMKRGPPPPLALLFFNPKHATGTYNDKHEAAVNVTDRNERFLPEYRALWEAGPHQIEHQGECISVDVIPSEKMELRVTKVPILGADGNTRMIDMGGQLPDGDERVPLLASHDESCFKAGEFEKWVSAPPILICTLHVCSLVCHARRGSRETGKFAWTSLQVLHCT